jgi:hypothetical protein
VRHNINDKYNTTYRGRRRIEERLGGDEGDDDDGGRRESMCDVCLFVLDTTTFTGKSRFF